MPLTLRPYQPGDEVAILDLFRTVFGRDLPIAFWRWRFQESPGGHGVIDLAFEGQRVVAHSGVTAIRLGHRGRILSSGLSGTTMTHPDHRGAGLLTELSRRTYERMRAQGMISVWGFPNSNSHRRLTRQCGWRDIQEIPFFTAELAPLGEVRAERPVERMTGAGDDVDDLWGRCAAEHEWSVVRDAAYVRWRFLANPSERYALHALREGSTLLGYAAAKEYGEALQVVDLLAASPADGMELVRHAIGEARARGKARVEMWLNTATPLHLDLEKLGFRPAAPVTYFGAVAFGPEAEGIHTAWSWRYAMADSDVF